MSKQSSLHDKEKDQATKGIFLSDGRTGQEKRKRENMPTYNENADDLAAEHYDAAVAPLPGTLSGNKQEIGSPDRPPSRIHSNTNSSPGASQKPPLNQQFSFKQEETVRNKLSGQLKAPSTSYELADVHETNFADQIINYDRRSQSNQSNIGPGPGAETKTPQFLYARMQT